MNHGDQPLLREGTELSGADAAVVLLHGRGASARSILAMTAEFDLEGVAYLAPQAAQRTWYPQSFLEPIERNEPWLTAALDRVGEVVTEATDGVGPYRVALIGFSQGACLASEWTARNARRYGGLAALSGGLIGPEETPRDYEGSLDGTPVFLGCSDVDPHIPVERVHETREVFERLDGEVTESIYEGMGHGINEDELSHVSTMVSNLLV
ncbi:phospholipase/carboxylesterase [Halalkaliarchaeum desulfuricum]|uniref:Phospholipase/carboxylesterase n=1 Tax=Halalkaliarchaeum desulfuricum TaxID=2055893 RepID=A0A343TKJ4_9EURY|nr:dienelactone hydrolase family protein [Halalkaliarchaeum desulfuricum]AUX09616.1 phospholipase/carboxylesterase [Halalkaliarchaeum desulfuricum]